MDRHKSLQDVHLSDVPLASEEEQRLFFAASLERALAAEARLGIVERWFEVAGATLCLSFAGRRLVDFLVPALSHLEVPPASRADAVIHIWDSESTGIAMVPPICPDEHFTSRGDIWSMLSRRFRSAFLRAESAVSLMDVEAGVGIYWTNAADALPFWAMASPLRSILHWWTESRGCQLIHGAVVGAGREGVLLAGAGGIGKSTAALACLAQGLEYLGDDFLVVEPGPHPRAHSLYSTGKLDWSQMSRFPGFAGLARNHGGPEGDKAVLYLHPALNGQLALSMTLKAILAPRIVDMVESGIGPVDASLVERAASFSTMTLLPHAGAHTQAFIQRLAAGLPGFGLDMGSDIAAIAATIGGMLARSPENPAAQVRHLNKAAMASRPLVSAIVPVRDGASFLPEAIASIQAQNYPTLEIIVVDDGSTDDIEGVLRNLPASIRYFRQEPAGPAAARNRGIREARGEFIAFLDVDDLWPPDNLGTMVDAIAGDPEWDVVHGFAQIMRQMPHTGQFEFVGNPLEIFLDYLSAALYRRSAFERVGILDESLLYFEDVDWFYRAREGGLAIKRLQQISLYVRRHAKNMTRDGTQRDFSLVVVKKILDHKRRRTPRPVENRASLKRAKP